MPKVKIEHIDALSQGKKSGIKLGSRAVPHHLYQYERDEYERALERGYLIIDIRSRTNLENLWLLVCESQKIPHLVLKKEEGRGEVILKGDVVFSGSLVDAKNCIRELVKNLA
ncbi:MAG: hypothetical protein PHU93_04240 [Candidatus Gracilibacteria bacterium]|nr:hypothetical protein [Candidatus Gracilibacteria bacterium]